MSLFNKHNLLAGFGAFIIGSATFAAVWGLPNFLTPSATIQSQVIAYLLDDRGAVNGLLLASGDQLRFSPRTGAAVAAQIRIGDEVTATGRPGANTNYGRQVRLEQIAANGRTIIAAHSGPRHTHEPRDGRGRRGHGDRPAPPAAPAPAEARTEQNAAPGSDAGANRMEQEQPAPPQRFRATGAISAHLVNGRGAVDGLILSSGEQVRFSPEVGKLVIAAEQGADTQVRVEGAGAQSELGTVIRPALLTVGNQTIAVGR